MNRVNEMMSQIEFIRHPVNLKNRFKTLQDEFDFHFHLYLDDGKGRM